MMISEISEILRKRFNELEEIKKLCEKVISNSPKGSLYFRVDHGFTRYYRNFDKESSRKYLGKNKIDEIKALENKNYYALLEKACLNLEEKLEDIIEILKDAKDPEQVFLLIDKKKTHLIKEYSLKPGYALNKAAKIQFDMKVPENLNFVTKAGERVRSKSELIIANMLFDANIPYGYEMSEVGNYRPDFTVLNEKTGKLYYWEHLGMLDNPDYLESSVIKLNNYAAKGYLPGKNLIVTFETVRCPLNTKHIEKLIKEYLIY